jgi:DNA gyrase/topoisomerase IV subunit B
MANESGIVWDPAEIKVVTHNEAIRKRPAMYIGPLDDPALPTKLLREALNVAFKKVGQVNDIRIYLSYRIGDARVSFDASFPVEMQENGKRMSELLLTQFFGYPGAPIRGHQASLHDGLPTLVALCSDFDFYTCSDGYEWYQFLEKGIPGDFTKTCECDAKRTEFMFTLDETIFGANRRFDTEAIRIWLAESFSPEHFIVEDYQPSL